MISFDIPGVYEALDLVMRYYPDQFTDEAKIEIDTLLSHCLEGLADDSEKFLSTLFIRSLKSFIGETGLNEHIYLKKYEISQIQLFDVLIRKFPFVRTAHELTNNAILNLLEGKQHVTILDVGIGLGTQMRQFLNSIPEDLPLESLRIVGIEPSEDALEKTRFVIHQELSRFAFRTEFIGINGLIENISMNDLQERIGNKGSLIINASLALHHIQTLENRNKVIGNLRKLNPIAFFLTEPNVDHFDPDFYIRFQNCYRHFYHVFQVIDRIDAELTDKNGLKLFFGREIEDIIGKGNSDRYEKHEPAYRWIEKLRGNGFDIHRVDFDEYPDVGCDVRVIQEIDDFIGLVFENEMVLTVICATPN